MRPLFRLWRPVIASISSVCPLPSTPAMPTISPARTWSETPRTFSRPRSSSTCTSSSSSTTSVGLAGGLSTRRSTSRPTIMRARLSSVAPSPGTVSIFFPRRRTVMRSAISSTSFSLWLMKMIDIPFALQALQDPEELRRLLRGQHGGRLVEDEDVRARGRAPSGSRPAAAVRPRCPRSSRPDRSANPNCTARSRTRLRAAS